MTDSGEARAAGRTRRIGVVGTMVWDHIHYRDAREVPIEEWGGIGYTLQALSASLPEGWVIVPLVKLGRDRSESALRWLRSIPRVEVGAGVMVVPEPNNRVEIRYSDADRRAERLEGGVPPWLWPELLPHVVPLDALYVNFISGFEMGLETAEALRVGFEGPIYADLHSLFLGMGARGSRFPRELPAAGRWLRCFDAVQLNDDEFALLGRAQGDPWHLAAEVVGPELGLILVTMGGAGAGYVARHGFDPRPGTWASSRGSLADRGPARSGRVPLESPVEKGDPTGCGDVWGATFFSGLLAGRELEESMVDANRMAARNVRHRGADGLSGFLLGRISEQGVAGR